MMTEPELVSIGANAGVDDGMLIAHLNTRGVFSLGPLTLGENCVVRSWARMQQGAIMQEGSVLAEHTLLMPGEVVQAGMLKQGWPADVNEKLRVWDPHASFS